MRTLYIIMIFFILGCNNTELWNPGICELRQVLIEEYENNELVSSTVPENPIIYNADDYGNVDTVKISEGLGEGEYIISTFKRFCKK